MDQFFTLFANCMLVKGHNRSALYDLHKGTIQLVPNDLYHIFGASNCIDIKSTMSALESERDRETVQEYLDFLQEEDYGFYSKRKPVELLKPMPDEYHYPHSISNILIDIASFEVTHLSGLRDQIEELHIRNVEIRIFDTAFDLACLNTLHQIFSSSNVLTLSLVLPHNQFQDIAVAEYCKFRLSRLIFYNCREDDHLEYNGTKVTFSTKSDLGPSCCGVIDQKYFSVNIPMYTESLHHNSCLNRKIAVDASGNIKNCPSMPRSFGNIQDTTLAEALHQADFTKYWNIKKDQIQVCKVCEFRHVCSDCRAYVEDPEDIFSKPLKCGYNPYTSQWEAWSTNPLKQAAIKYYGLEN